MNKAKRKNILIDLSDLKHPNCGFGQIAINYSKRFANLPIEGLHFFYLLPNCCPKIHSKKCNIRTGKKQKNQEMVSIHSSQSRYMAFCKPI